MTPAELTSLLAPVRAELGAIEEDSNASESDPYGLVPQAVERVRAALDKLDPNPDAGLVVLGIAALGMLKELKESSEISVYSTRRPARRSASVSEWIERADALLAAAYPADPVRDALRDSLASAVGTQVADAVFHDEAARMHEHGKRHADGPPKPFERWNLLEHPQVRGACPKCGTNHAYHVSRYQPPIEVSCSMYGHSWRI